jgi:hypothetical protein
MKNKPWPILILALIHLFMPIFNLLLNSTLIQSGPIEYAKLFVDIKSWYEIFDFFLLYPIVGISIFLMKKWSYLFFLLATLWTFSMNSYLWLTGNTPPIPFWLFPLVSLINVAFATYFLLPAVRRLYFDQRLKWWESKPRFEIQIPANIKSSLDTPITICDLSEGGAFVKTTEIIQLSEEAFFEFTYEGYNCSIPFEVVHQKEMQANEYGLGLKFLHNNDSFKQIRSMLKQLKIAGTPMTRMPDPLFLSFKVWFKKVKDGTTGDGFL